jgi:UDP-N-acetyl-D-mannosaminuronate dehydrogenase
VRVRLGYPFRFVELAQEINATMPAYVARRAQNILNEAGLATTGANILLLGVTYKANIADERESPAVPLARDLSNLGAKISYHDPFVEDWRPGVSVLRVDDLETAVTSADLVILIQHHRDYDADKLAATAKRFFDTRGVTRTDDAIRL